MFSCHILCVVKTLQIKNYSKTSKNIEALKYSTIFCTALVCRAVYLYPSIIFESFRLLSKFYLMHTIKILLATGINN